MRNLFDNSPLSFYKISPLLLYKALNYLFIKVGNDIFVSTKRTMLIGMTKDKKQRNNEEMKWKTLSSKQLIDRPWMRVRCDKVQLPDGRVHEEYYVLSYPSWVNVIAETEEGDIILERQYRHGLDIVSTEICAGVMEEGETPLEAAQRELEEETGYTGGEWKEIMTVAPNPGVMDNLCHCFYAKGVKKNSEQHLDDTEDIDVLLCPKQEVKQMLIRGEFIQALMVAPLWKFFSTEF
jgi:hydrolase, NUDIX family